MTQLKDDTQVLKDSEEIALDRKRKTGLQGYLPLQLQGAGSCSCPPKTERATGRAQHINGSMHREADCPAVGAVGSSRLTCGLRASLSGYRIWLVINWEGQMLNGIWDTGLVLSSPQSQF